MNPIWSSPTVAQRDRAGSCRSRGQAPHRVPGSDGFPAVQELEAKARNQLSSRILDPGQGCRHRSSSKEDRKLMGQVARPSDVRRVGEVWVAMAYRKALSRDETAVMAPGTAAGPAPSGCRRCWPADSPSGSRAVCPGQQPRDTAFRGVRMVSGGSNSRCNVATWSAGGGIRRARSPPRSTPRRKLGWLWRSTRRDIGGAGSAAPAAGCRRSRQGHQPFRRFAPAREGARS